jgi:protoporphyrinogen/coproporphyrinogen III oxidase
VSSSPNIPVAIVGGGISGLAAAYYLSKRGIASTLIEARPFLGGILHTEHIEGCTVEAGADSWLASKTSAAELARELGLGSDIIGSNDEVRRTWIWKGGELIPFPEGMQLVAPTRFGPIWRSRLLSPSTKLRIALDWLRPPTGKLAPERSIATFVGDHFGREAVDYVAEPLLTGIYGGDVNDLSASSVVPKLVEHERVHGSLVRGLITAKHSGSLFQSLRGGLGALPGALRPASVIHGRVEQIARAENGFKLRVNADWLMAREIVLACEAHQTARLVEEIDPVLATWLSKIRHSTGHIAAMGFRRAEVRHPLDGFGFLVPRREGRNLTASTWVSSKFPERAPPEMALIRAFFREKPADPLADLREIMGIKAEPVFIRSYEWPASLAQYSVGHAGRIAAIEVQVSRTKGLHLIGNAYHGVGIPDCIALAKQTADRINVLPTTPT